MTRRPTKGQTTVPKAVRDALALETGDKLSWVIRGGRVAITTERPSLLDFEGFIKNSSGDVVAEIAEACKRRAELTSALTIDSDVRHHLRLVAPPDFDYWPSDSILPSTVL